MKILAHDAYYTFDYVAWVNAVFDMFMTAHNADKVTDERFGISASIMAKVFRYEPVSLPTMLRIEYVSGVRLNKYLIKLD